MKNQYFGDIGDYGKYAMLRYLAKDGIKIGVNWYLTEDDGSNDGKFTSYLEKEDMRRYDPELFDILKEMVGEGKRDVTSFSERNAIVNASFYNAILTDDRKQRAAWHESALRACNDAELVFLDPDNGASENKTGRNSGKFCFPEEIADYYNAGHNVVYYCQKARRTYEQWEEAKGLMQKYLPDCKIFVITYHKGTQRSYIFVLHKNDFRRYATLMTNFCRRWFRIFTEETVGSVKVEYGVKMIIRKATISDIDAVEKLYDDIHTAEENGKQAIGWIRGVYPVRATAEMALKRDDLFVLEDAGKIYGTGIINKIQADSYRKGRWKHEVADNQVCVLHTLVISPDSAGRGYGRAFVEYYEKYALDNGCIELRIDTNARNTVARAMYKKHGYTEIGIIPTDFNGIPGVNLVLLEKYLGK